MKKLIILDTSAIIHRAYHALPTLTDKEGNPVGAIYGLSSILLKIFKELEPDMIVAALDRPEPSFRKELDPEYQSQRKEADEDLKNQFEIAEKVLDSFGIKKLSKPSYEADDIIGTICEESYKDRKIETIVVSGDLDICQLIDDQTSVMMMKRGITDTIIYDPKNFKEKFPFEPINLIDYKGLRGDSSDNIKGVPRVGEKAAMILIEKFGTIEKLYQALESFSEDELDTKSFEEKFKVKIPNYQLKALIENKDSAFMSKKLATIIKNVDVKVRWREFEIRNKINRTKLDDHLTNLGFRTIVDRLDSSLNGYFSSESDRPQLFPQNDPVKEEAKKPGNYILVSENTIDDFIKELKGAEYFALDTEGTELDPIKTELIGASFAFKADTAYYLPLSIQNGLVDQISNIKNSKKYWLKIQNLLEDSNKQIIGHNIKYDYKVLKRHGISLPNPFFDTMLAAYFIDSETSSFSLDDLALRNFDHEMIPISDLIGKDKKGSMKDAPLEKVAPYAAEDADYTWKLFELFTSPINPLSPSEQEAGGKGMLRSDPKTQKIFHEIEMPLLPILGDMELRGVKVDQDVLKKAGERIKKNVKKAREKIHELAGEEFNINSNKELPVILFEKLKISTAGIRRTGKGAISTAASELEKLSLAGAHPIIDEILKYRENNKLLSTYINGLLKQINKKTGRVHTSYLQTGAITGRLSSVGPNLQNIPTRTEAGEVIRKAFVADRGNRLIKADYSQIELRIAAHMSEDPVMIKAFREGKDFHQATAAMIFDMDEKDVTKDNRRIAKTINFGILYGLSAYGLSQQLGIGRNEAQEYIDRYFRQFSRLNIFIKQLVKKAQHQGFVETLFGRRRYITGLGTNQYRQRMHAERIAVNTPFQGTNADIIKIAMIRINEVIERSESFSKDLKMLMQVHDELVFECPKDKTDDAAKMIKKEMEGVAKLSAPLIVDIQSGQNWVEMDTMDQ